MPDYPYFPYYPKDILSDHKAGLRMDNRAYGAYHRLLAVAWHETPPATLPTDDAILADYAKESLDGWRVIRPVVLACFVERNGRWIQPRLRKEYEKLAAIRKRQSEAGKERWRDKSPNSSPNSSPHARGCGSGSISDAGSTGGGEGGGGGGDGSHQETGDRKQETQDSPPIAPWPRADFDAAAKNVGCTDSDRDQCWAYYDSQGWFKSNNRRVTGDPRSILTSWMANPQRAPTAPPQAQNGPAGTGTAKREAWKVQADIDALQKIHTKQWQWHEPNTPDEKAEFKRQKERLKELGNELAKAL